eukprot:GHVS01094632.1.p1 GENE.GHVS01094632.1~~GHVS01094632.1.p1  ORF type:complete len:229 (+),score=17.32 GHVS01094632.1:83-769(+)
MEYFPDESCAVCLDILTEPCTLKCTHSFCKRCLVGVRNCPLCRVAIQGRVLVRKKLKTQLEKRRVQCRICQELLPLGEATRHGCPGGIPVWTDRHRSVARPTSPPRAVSTPKPIAQQPAPNNSLTEGRESTGVEVYSIDEDETFDCPVCECKDMQEGRFVRHVVELHRDVRANSICPICDSYPWASRNLMWNDVVQHVICTHAPAAMRVAGEEDADLQIALLRSRHDW